MAEERLDHGKFTIIVMTKPEEFEVREGEMMRTVSQEALKRAGFGTDLSNWELKDTAGHIVPFDQTERQAGVRPGSRYFLTQKIGAGG
jgi:hypothetical protein